MRFWASASAVLLVTAVAYAQSAIPHKTAQAKPLKCNELTLAGLRPGRDLAKRAIDLNHRLQPETKDSGAQLAWTDVCQGQTLTVDTDANKRIQVVRVGQKRDVGIIYDCKAHVPQSRWKTSRGLHLWDEAPRVIQLYGEPDSRSPSTKDGRKLELLYYAFDWAGPDVPQVMEVLCTVEDDGKPGRVVEIILAAPSL
jgi:hypothetical protein